MARTSDRLLDLFQAENLLDSAQYAFLRGGSTATPIEIMTAIVQDSRARGKPCHLVLLDATSAYDTIPDYATDIALASIGAPPEFIKISGRL